MVLAYILADRSVEGADKHSGVVADTFVAVRFGELVAGKVHCFEAVLVPSSKILRNTLQQNNHRNSRG